MNWHRYYLKVRWEGVSGQARRVLSRLWSRRALRRRRAYWGRPPEQLAATDLPESFTPCEAQRLWPGAAERTWVAKAPGLWPEDHARASRLAEDAAAGYFDLLGSGRRCVLRADGGLRWHDDFKADATFPAERLYLDVPICLGREGTDIKVPWELSRFQHVFAFIWTDPDRYRDVFLRQWEDWLESNPVGRGPNWACAMDVALRAVSWTAAWAAWGDTFDAVTRRRMGTALAVHGAFIRDNLEWQPKARTNHYFSDIVGLAVIGAVLSPYPPARAWLDFAARELRREILEQFAADGFNRECSTSYHRLMVELATLAWLACRVGGCDLGQAVRERLAAAYRAIALLCDGGGEVALVGDNDSGRVFSMVPRDDRDMQHLVALGAAVVPDSGVPDVAPPPPPEAALLCGPDVLAGVMPTNTARRGEKACGALRDAGLYVLGDDKDQMVVRCGPLTYRPVGSHRHLDQLAITLSAAGRAILVDPGQYCYTPWPKVFQSYCLSAAHNTVIVDDEPQCRVFFVGWYGISIIHEVRPACEAWESSTAGGRFVGRHKGYRRLKGGADHEREVAYEREPRRWRVVDRLALRGAHRVQWRFHLHPDVTVVEDGEAWSLRRDEVAVMLRCSGTAAPRGQCVPGWCAPAYGRQVRTQVLEFQLDSTGPVEEQFEFQADGKR